MANIVTLKYGMDVHRISVDQTSTIGQLLANPSTKAVLGYGDNVKALIHGIEQDTNTQIGNCSEIVIETRANSKAN